MGRQLCLLGVYGKSEAGEQRGQGGAHAGVHAVVAVDEHPAPLPQVPSHKLERGRQRLPQPLAGELAVGDGEPQVVPPALCLLLGSC